MSATEAMGWAVYATLIGLVVAVETDLIVATGALAGFALSLGLASIVLTAFDRGDKP